MIIENDEGFRHNLSQHLCLKAHEVFETTREEDVKEILRSEEIDVVLLDLRGLKHEGLYLLRTIKTLSPHTEVILITSSDLLSLSIAGMKLGAFDDLLVPFDLETLLERIWEAYHRKHRNQKAQGSGL